MSAPVFLIACSKAKAQRATTARQLYQGDLFRKSVAYAEREGGRWFVLSALHGLAPLVPSFGTLEAARAGMQLDADAMPEARVWRMPPGPDRERERSRFFPGIARAMAEQWGGDARRELAA